MRRRGTKSPEAASAIRPPRSLLVPRRRSSPLDQRRECCSGRGLWVKILLNEAKHKLIVEQEVTNAGSDLGLLAPTATAAKEALEADKIKAVADSGYYKGEDIAACEAAGIEAYVPRPQRGFAVREGLFRKEEFHYDAQNDVYVCPGNQQLHPRYRSSGGEHDRIYYCNRDACRHCELKSRCTTNPYRQVARWIDEAVLDRMETRLKANPHILRACLKSLMPERGG